MQGKKSYADKREVVVDLLKGELNKDVATMHKVAGKGESDAVWKDINNEKGTDEEKKELINEIKGRIVNNENVVASQDLDSLKN
jgi:hypothetical protein